MVNQSLDVAGNARVSDSKGMRLGLFDTGSDSPVLFKSMVGLDLAPASVDLLFLSHPHWDHTDGLDSFRVGKPDLIP